jgi:hypothetical protein
MGDPTRRMRINRRERSVAILRSRSMTRHGNIQRVETNRTSGVDRPEVTRRRRLGIFRAFLAALAFATETTRHNSDAFLEGGSDDSASRCIALTALSGRALC